jgi:hypothetical protein
LAAVLGLVGGMAGAAVGGYVANEGQEQRFEHERATEIRDLRIDTYVKFLRAAEGEHNEPVETDDRIVRTAEAEVSLVAPTNTIREAASQLTKNVLEATTEDEYTRLRNAFVDLAQVEIEPVEQAKDGRAPRCPRCRLHEREEDGKRVSARPLHLRSCVVGAGSGRALETRPGGRLFDVGGDSRLPHKLSNVR